MRKEPKTAAVYTIPWFVLMYIVSVVEGATIGLVINLSAVHIMLNVVFHGLISVFLSWVVWLYLDVPKHLAKYV